MMKPYFGVLSMCMGCGKVAKADLAGVAGKRGKTCRAEMTVRFRTPPGLLVISPVTEKSEKSWLRLSWQRSGARQKNAGKPCAPACEQNMPKVSRRYQLHIAHEGAISHGIDGNAQRAEDTRATKVAQV